MAQIPYMNWMGDQPTGSAYDVYQYYLGGGGPGGTPAGGGGGGGIASLPWYLQTGGGGGGGDFKGGGQWGNLDLSKGKMFDKNVYSMDMAAPGAPMTASFKPGQVQGYYNPTLGQYQTLEGKNINHLGIPIKPMFASMLESMGVGGKNKYGLDLKHRLGSTEGTFSKGWESGKGKIKEGWEDEKEKWAKIFGSKKRKEKKKKEIADYNEKKWKEVQAEKESERQRNLVQQVQQNIQTYGSGDRPDTGMNVAGGGKGQSPTGGNVEGTPFAEGGMIKDLTKDPEYRGWKKMYEANPGVGSMHEKHKTFIKFYKQHERDKKKFGGLAGLLYG